MRRTGDNGGVHTAGLLLTGGASRRFGRDKALLPVDGTPAAVRLADVLSSVVSPAREVGPGRTSLARVRESSPEGPLVAVAAGVAALRADGFDGGAVVLACDLPLVDAALVRYLAGFDGTAVPVVDGRPQSLCARYSAAALDTAVALVASGERRMSALVDAGPVTWLGEDDWGAVATGRTFADVDTPADAAALGLLVGGEEAG